MQSEDQVPRDQVEEEARRPVEDEKGDADLSEERVDEEVDAKAAWVLVASARKTLVQGGGMDQLKDNLRGKIKFLDADNAREVRAGGLEEVTLDGWVEELLRFIALKTLMDDTNLPFQLAPSGQIKIAGRLLVELGSSYTNVCQAMGNASAIDPVAFLTNRRRSICRNVSTPLCATTRSTSMRRPLIYSGRTSSRRLTSSKR